MVDAGSTDQPLEGGNLSEELVPGLSWATEQDGVRRNIRDYASLSTNLCTLSNVQMTGHCRLTADLNEVLQYR